MTAMEAQGRAMFSVLRPLCVQVLNSPSRETLQQLREGVATTLDAKCLHPHIVDYVLLPVRTVISKTGSSDPRLLEEGLVTLATILSHVKDLQSWELFHNIVVFLCMVLDKKMSVEAGFVSRSEDLVLFTVKALKSLLLCLAPSARQMFFSHLPALGHCVSVLLDTLQTFRDKTLRRETLSALLALSGVDSSDLLLQLPKETSPLQGGPPVGDESLNGVKPKQTVSVSETLESSKASHIDCDHVIGYLNGLLRTIGIGPANGGRIFASFLPGVSIAITKLVTTDTNVGSSVTLLALLTWAHYVSMVMDDSQCREKEAQNQTKNNTEINSYSTVPEQDMKRDQLGVKRTLSWQQETDSKLCLLVQKMSGLVTVESWKVRAALVGWANCLVTRCFSTLVKCIPAILEVLVTLTNDKHPLVSNPAHFTITQFSKRYSKDNQSLKLTSLLEERVYSLSSSLPRLMRATDDKRKITTLQLLSGYLRLLGPHVVSLSHSLAHLSRMVQALVQTLELQVMDTRIVECPLVYWSDKNSLLAKSAHRDQPTANKSDSSFEKDSFSSDSVRRVVKSSFVLPSKDGGSKEQHEGPQSDCLADQSDVGASLSLRFMHFREERIESLIYEVCWLLGCYGNPSVVIDHLLDMYRSLPSQRKEVLIILSHVLIGVGGLKEKPIEQLQSVQLFALVEGVLQEVLEQESESDGRTELSHAHPQDIVLFSCLLLKMISICGHILGLTFEPLLQLLSYPLMQRLGDSDSNVSMYARGVVLSIAINCGYSSIQDFISRNADYLVNTTALSLRSPSSPLHHSQAVSVLQAILRNGDASILHLIRDSLDDLLVSLDTRRQSPAHIWSVLCTLSESCLHWSTKQTLLPPANSAGVGRPSPNTIPAGVLQTPPNTDGNVKKETILSLSEGMKSSPSTKSEEEVAATQDHNSVSPDDIKKFFLDYHKQKHQTTEKGYKEGEDVSSEPVDEDLYEQKQKLSPISQGAVDVLQRCAHHLSSPEPQVQLLVLEALSCCLLALRDDQTTLLPEVHKVWSPFLPRLSDPSPYVALRAWKVMLVMCDVCGEFLRKRVVLKVWPPLTRSLESLAAKSLNADTLYRQSSHYKLLLCLFDCVSVLCVKLKVPTPDMEVLAHSCLAYLHRDQPLGLQQACLACLGGLIAYDPDTMWLLLIQLCPKFIPTPPNTCLKPFTFRCFPASDDYAVNVEVLLGVCMHV